MDQMTGLSLVRVACVTLFVITSTLNLKASDLSWYQSAAFHCDDPFSIQDTLMNGTWFHTYLDLHFTKISAGKGYVQINKGDYDGWINNPQGSSLEKHSLTTADAGALRVKLTSIADDKVVPTAINWTSTVMSYVGAGNLVTTGLLKYLSTQAGNEQATARVIGAVTAAGGEIDRVLTTGDAGGHRYLVHTFFYDVQVGTEKRQYALASCSYPVKLVFSEFRTTTPLNKKILRRKTGTAWALVDVDNGREEATWIEGDRDDDYLYFTESNDKYRVSLTGGAMQKNVAGTWGTLYKSTIGT